MDIDDLDITEIHISFCEATPVRAFVSILLGHSLVIRGIKVIDDGNRRFVAMPSRHTVDGLAGSVIRAKRASLRKALEERILAAFYEARGDDDDPKPPCAARARVPQPLPSSAVSTRVPGPSFRKQRHAAGQ